MENELQKHWRNWPYENTLFLIVSLSLFFYFASSDAIQNSINSVGDLGYLGALITGVFFVSIFTVVPATVILFDLALSHDSIMVALLAGVGAVAGDYIIFRFFA